MLLMQTMAAEKGRLEIVRDLLERKADPTHRDAGENTPLHFAAQVSRLSTCTSATAQCSPSGSR